MKKRYCRVRSQIIKSNLEGNLQIDLNFFYDYFLEKSGSNIDPGTFQMIFMQGDFRSVISHLDREFGLSILVDSDGTELKLIE